MLGRLLWPRHLFGLRMRPVEVPERSQGKSRGEREPGAIPPSPSAHLGAQMGSCPSLVQLQAPLPAGTPPEGCLGQDKGSDGGV